MKASSTVEIISAATHAVKRRHTLEPFITGGVKNTTNALGVKETDDQEKMNTFETLTTKTEQQKTREAHVIDLKLPGGHLEKGINPLEGAKLWSKQYFPNLDSQTNIFKSDYDMPIPTLDFTDEKKLDDVISTKASEKDASYLKDMKVRMKGIKGEMKVMDMLVRSLRITEPKTIISNFHWSNFCGLFKNFTCHPKGSDQEIDHVIILGEYSTVIMLEVKTSTRYCKSMVKSLDRKDEI